MQNDFIKKCVNAENALCRYISQCAGYCDCDPTPEELLQFKVYSFNSSLLDFTTEKSNVELMFKCTNHRYVIQELYLTFVSHFSSCRLWPQKIPLHLGPKTEHSKKLGPKNLLLNKEHNKGRTGKNYLSVCIYLISYKHKENIYKCTTFGAPPLLLWTNLLLQFCYGIKEV